MHEGQSIIKMHAFDSRTEGRYGVEKKELINGHISNCMRTFIKTFIAQKNKECWVNYNIDKKSTKLCLHNIYCLIYVRKMIEVSRGSIVWKLIRSEGIVSQVLLRWYSSQRCRSMQDDFLLPRMRCNAVKILAIEAKERIHLVKVNHGKIYTK